MPAPAAQSAAIPNEFAYRPGVPFTPLEALADRLCRATWTSNGAEIGAPCAEWAPSISPTSAFNDTPDFYDEWMRCARFVEQMLADGRVAYRQQVLAAFEQMAHPVASVPA